MTTKDLMARMGHGSPAATLRYQHATSERDRAIADGLSVSMGANVIVVAVERDQRASR